VWTLRAFVDASIEKPVGDHRFVSRTTVAAVESRSAVLPAQELVYLGGPVSGPGYRYHAFAAELGGTQHLEWRMRAPFIGIPLGRFGRAPPSMTLAPYAHTVFVAQPRNARPGWYPSLGVGAYLFFDAVRLDAARGLRDGKWTFTIDVSPELWRVL
jgi:hypothetical protein